MEERLYEDIFLYLKDGVFPEHVTNKSNWRQKTKNFVIGDTSKYGSLYYRKLLIKKKFTPISKSNKPIVEWKEDKDYRVHEEPIFTLLAVVKISQCEELFTSVHVQTCHGGRNSMRYHLKSYYIERKESLIKKYKVCPRCDELKALPEQLPFTPIFSKAPGERIQFDFTFYDSWTVFTVIDHFSKFAFAFPAATRKSSLVIEYLEKSIEKLQKDREVNINILHSDNGAEFCSKQMKEFCKDNEYQLIHGRVRHPQSQGCIERFHRTLKNNISLLIQTGKTFEQSLKLSVKAYNNSFHHTLGMTPKEALNTVAQKNPSQTQISTILQVSNSIANLQQKRSALDSKLKSKRINPERKIKIGDIVYYKLKEEKIRGVVVERSKNNRIKAKWDKPFADAGKFISLSHILKSMSKNDETCQDNEIKKSQNNITSIENDFNLYYESDVSQSPSRIPHSPTLTPCSPDPFNLRYSPSPPKRTFSPSVFQLSPKDKQRRTAVSPKGRISLSHLCKSNSEGKNRKSLKKHSPKRIALRRSNRKPKPISKSIENNCFQYSHTKRVK